MSTNSFQHAYAEYEGSSLWKEVAKLVRELEENNDLTVTTRPEYVIGYICRGLEENKLINSESLSR